MSPMGDDEYYVEVIDDQLIAVGLMIILKLFSQRGFNYPLLPTVKPTKPACWAGSGGGRYKRERGEKEGKCCLLFV